MPRYVVVFDYFQTVTVYNILPMGTIDNCNWKLGTNQMNDPLGGREGGTLP